MAWGPPVEAAMATTIPFGRGGSARAAQERPKAAPIFVLEDDDQALCSFAAPPGHDNKPRRGRAPHCELERYSVRPACRQPLSETCAVESGSQLVQVAGLGQLSEFVPRQEMQGQTPGPRVHIAP